MSFLSAETTILAAIFLPLAGALLIRMSDRRILRFRH